MLSNWQSSASFYNRRETARDIEIIIQTVERLAGRWKIGALIALEQAIQLQDVVWNRA